jgi:hypothetical protein
MFLRAVAPRKEDPSHGHYEAGVMTGIANAVHLPAPRKGEEGVGQVTTLFRE